MGRCARGLGYKTEYRFDGIFINTGLEAGDDACRGIRSRFNGFPHLSSVVRGDR